MASGTYREQFEKYGLLGGGIMSVGKFLQDVSGGLGKDAAKATLAIGDTVESGMQAASRAAFGQSAGDQKLSDAFRVPIYSHPGPVIPQRPGAETPVVPTDVSGTAGGSAAGDTTGGTGATGGFKERTPTFNQTDVVDPNLIQPNVPPKKSFNFDPLTPGAEDYMALFENDANASGFYSRMLGGVGQAQTGVVDTRAQQNLPSQDLQGARAAEGWENARGAWLDVQRRVSDFNRRVSNIEQEVRDDLGGEVTESAVQAEVNNRMRQMQPEFNRLNAELTNVKAYYDSTVDAVSQNFNARRADAEEKVDRAAQILGFGKENINSAYSLMSGLKNFEITVDAQKSEKRDAARAAASLAISSPGGLTRLSPQALANLEAQAQFAPGTLAGIADLQKQGPLAIHQLDDAGNFIWAQLRSDGTMATGAIQGLATIYPKTSSTSSLRSAANRSPAFKPGGAVDSIMFGVVAAFQTGENGEYVYSTAQRQQVMNAAIAKMQSQVQTDADQYVVDRFKANIAGTTENTADKILGELAAISG